MPGKRHITEQQPARRRSPGDMASYVLQTLFQMPRQIEIIVVPEVQVIGMGVGQVKHPAPDEAQRADRRRFIDDANPRMIEFQWHRMLIVDQQRGLR
jgi:hypothetical protein